MGAAEKEKGIEGRAEEADGEKKKYEIVDEIGNAASLDQNKDDRGTECG